MVLPAVPKRQRTRVIREKRPTEKLNSIDNVYFQLDADETEVCLALLELGNLRLIKKLTEEEVKGNRLHIPKGFNIEFSSSDKEIQKMGIQLVDGDGNAWDMDLIQYKKNGALEVSNWFIILSAAIAPKTWEIENKIVAMETPSSSESDAIFHYDKAAQCQVEYSQTNKQEL
ncbi:hypothetical protein Vadar_018874 [Vaccinium darrowii]|uniref:Uncharacterized protein n=1 Tax=Vaccinium darrowii TaxID=229202 RepID=A0ACB7ZDK6_9ERIC|nr:hypothetical protein Vadar_018874 [Vaccinium darrowii]